jgi:hypothetical protein
MRTRIGLTLLAAAALVGCKSSEGKSEVKVAMADVPAPVKATLEHEAAGGKITEVEKETKNGKVVYSADVTDKAGKKWDVDVGEDGKLISKERD